MNSLQNLYEKMDGVHKTSSLCALTFTAVICFFEEAFKKAYKVKGPAIIDLTIKKDSLVLPMLKPGGTFNNLILRREDISDA